jgi:hypothetical protein
MNMQCASRPGSKVLGTQFVNEGLLKKDSPRGVWEISGKGQSYPSRAR